MDEERLPAAAPAGAYERERVPFRPLAVFAAASLAAAVLIHLGLWLVFAAFSRSEERKDREGVRTAVPGPRPAAPEPRLQGVPGFHRATPREDMAELRRRQTGVLETWGRTEEEGYVRIPIERAIELIVERGLPGANGSLPPGGGR